MQEEEPSIECLYYIVSSYQNRTFAEDVKQLASRGSNLSDWLTKLVDTDLTIGINGEQSALEQRRRKYGSNAKQKKIPPGICHYIWQALDDFTLRVLLVSACVSIILQTSTADSEDRKIAWIDGFGILIAVFICVAVTAVNDYQKQRQFMKLNTVADSQKTVTVWRSGNLLELHQDNLLVGDVVNISQGMQIPADGILFQSSQVTVDQSSMTGQADHMIKNILKFCVKKKQQLQRDQEVQKNDKNQVPSPILMSGTKVMTGQGKMVVVVVGDLSCLGKLKKLLEQQDDEMTPLQQKLDTIAKNIGKFGIYSAIFIVVVLLIRFAIVKGTAEAEEDKWKTSQDIVNILNFFILGITVIVVAIPQGLPLSVTMSLALSVQKMLDDQNLVRRMQACETMGGANNICSDKTGTLTMNQMVLTQFWSGSTKKVNVHQAQLKQQDYFENKQFMQVFKLASMINSSAELQPPKGSSTEIAFLKFFKKMGINYTNQRTNYNIQVKFPFSSSRKRMSIIVNYKGYLYLFTKGASEMVLHNCSHMINSTTGNQQTIDTVAVDKVIVGMAERSLRTLCLAYKRIASHDNFQNKDSKGLYDVEKNNLVLIAVVGVRDTPRAQVPEAIRECHKAGITVRMVTGDNIITATAIAKEIGLVSDAIKWRAMQGSSFVELVGGIVCSKCKTKQCDCPITAKQAEEQDKQIRKDIILNGQKFDEIKDELLILARSRPEDKYCLVTGLKERGNVVAVTGDGTNDAPALKKADVGFAMGIAGTEVARDAASIILVDDNFKSIVRAVLWGRNIYDSIRKFIQFQLTVNVVAVTITLVGAALIQRDVFKPIQMLWVNLIMDSLASIALATEDPTPQLLNRKPHGRDESIVNVAMFKHIIGQSIFQIIILLIIIFMGEQFIPQYMDSNDSDSIYITNPQYKWHNGVYGGNIASGRFFHINGDKDYETAFDATKNYSRHFTIVFNTFVWLQIFDFLNARKLHQQFNIFAGILSNCLFPVIVIVIIGLQIILVTFPGYGFGVYNRGLSIQQWLICIGFGAISLVAGFLLKFLPCGKHKDETVLVNTSRVRPQSSEASIMNIVGGETSKKKSQDETGQFLIPQLVQPPEQPSPQLYFDQRNQ